MEAGFAPLGIADAKGVPSTRTVPSTIHLTRFVKGIPQLLGFCRIVTPDGTYIVDATGAAI